MWTITNEFSSGPDGKIVRLEGFALNDGDDPLSFEEAVKLFGLIAEKEDQMGFPA